jgi:hypothetical protein
LVVKHRNSGNFMFKHQPQRVAHWLPRPHLHTQVNTHTDAHKERGGGERECRQTINRSTLRTVSFSHTQGKREGKREIHRRGINLRALRTGSPVRTCTYTDTRTDTRTPTHTHKGRIPSQFFEHQACLFPHRPVCPLKCQGRVLCVCVCVYVCVRLRVCAPSKVPRSCC